MIRLAALCLSLAIVGPVAAQSQHSLDLLRQESTPIIARYLLQDPNGRSVTSEEFIGRYQLIAFGYTYCPDICPTTLVEMAQAQKQWTGMPDSIRPRVLFVSVDPERDTPLRIGEYAHAFHADTLAATADLPALEDFAKSLGFVFMKVPGKNFEQNPNDYSMDHSSGIAVIDPQGRVAGLMRPPFDPKAIATDMTALTQATLK